MSRAEKRAWWREEVERWRASGLRQSAYCRERGLPLAQFSYWKRRLACAAVSCSDEAALVPVSLVEGSGEAAAVELGVRELRWLLDGLEIGRIAAQAHRRLAYKTVS